VGKKSETLGRGGGKGDGPLAGSSSTGTHRSHHDGVDVLAVIDEGHVLLAEACEEGETEEG
jgi:hypothetical protein